MVQAEPHSHRLSVGLTVALSALVQSWGTLLIAFSPLLQADLLSGSSAKLGLLYSFVAWAGMLGTILGGLLSNRLSPSRILSTSLLVGSGIVVVTGMASHTVSFFASVSCLTFVLAVASIAATTLLPRLANRSSRRILSVQLAATGLVTMLLPIAVGVVQIGSGAASVFPFRVSCFLTAGGLLLGYMLMRPDTEPAKVVSSAQPAHQSAGYPRGVIAVVVTLAAVHISVDSTLGNFIPAYLQAFPEHPFPPAWILSGYSAGYLCSRLFLSFWPEGKYESLLLVAPGFIAALIELIGFHSGSYLEASFCYWFASLFCGLEYPVLLGFAARHLPQRFGTMLAVGGAAGGFFCAALSFVVGRIGESPGGLSAAFRVLPLGFVLFSAIAFVWILVMRYRPAVSERKAS
jgi:MFS family permease